MKIFFLHGWHSVPGGVKPTFLAQQSHEVINPKLPDEDFGAWREMSGRRKPLYERRKTQKRREISLPALRVNCRGAIIPLPFGKLPAQDSELTTVGLTAPLKNTGKTLSTCRRTIS